MPVPLPAFTHTYARFRQREGPEMYRHSLKGTLDAGKLET